MCTKQKNEMYRYNLVNREGLGLNLTSRSPYFHHNHIVITSDYKPAFLINRQLNRPLFVGLLITALWHVEFVAEQAGVY